jgi:hypothetical protein
LTRAGSKGTLGWQAPEILAAADEAEERREEEGENAAEEAMRKRIRVTKKVDIFAMGTTRHHSTSTATASCPPKALIPWWAP